MATLRPQNRGSLKFTPSRSHKNGNAARSAQPTRPKNVSGPAPNFPFPWATFRLQNQEARPPEMITNQHEIPEISLFSAGDPPGLRIRKRDASELITNQHEILEITSFWLSVGEPQAAKSTILKNYTLAKPQKRQCRQNRATHTPKICLNSFPILKNKVPTFFS